MTIDINNLDQSWKELYPKVYGYFYRRIEVKDDVEDLTSISLSSFFKVMLDADKSEKIQNQHAYLWKICHNQLALWIKNKSKQRIVVGLNDEIDSIDTGLENQFSDQYLQRIENLKDCIKNQLKDQDQVIVFSSLIEDMDSKSVAEVVGLKADNVRQRLKRAIAKLRNHCKQVWQN